MAMVTVIRLDLSDDERTKLHMAITGKKGKATRAMIEEWVRNTIYRKLNGPGDPTAAPKTRLQSMSCPKCGKVISVPVPVQAEAAKEAAPAGGGQLSHDQQVEALTKAILEVVRAK